MGHVGGGVSVDVACGNCALWQGAAQGPIVGQSGVGLCRRYPPTSIVLPDGRVVSAWATTQAAEGCAEFRPSRGAVARASKRPAVDLVRPE